MKFESELVNRCRSYNIAINPRPGFCEVGGHSLADSDHVIEAVERDLCFEISYVIGVRFNCDDQSSCADGASANEADEANIGANVKERVTGRERIGNRLLDQRLVGPQPNSVTMWRLERRQRRPRASPRRIDVTLPSR